MIKVPIQLILKNGDSAYYIGCYDRSWCFTFN